MGDVYQKEIEQEITHIMNHWQDYNFASPPTKHQVWLFLMDSDEPSFDIYPEEGYYGEE